MNKIFKEPSFDDNLPSFNFGKINKKLKKDKRKTYEESDVQKQISEVPVIKSPSKAKKLKTKLLNLAEDTVVKSKKSKKRKQSILLINRKETKGTDEEIEPEPEEPVKKKRKLDKDTRNVNGNTKSTLFSRLKNSLKGSRFRYLNELLYTSTGNEAVALFQNDQTAFEAYHEGYKVQVEQWSMNPLDRIIKNIQKMPKEYLVCDFGCGEAKLAKSVLQKVYSLDLVAFDNSVIACDMSNSPLESNSINVAVFCLSLMGTNLSDFLLEANRLLKMNGILKIAEVSSRFDSVKLFIDFIQKCGFTMMNKDLTHKLFYFFTFKKVKNVEKDTKMKQFSLKPCLYKKR
uniref:Ribosomal RNA-processing protein 8 n=1 Tax=Corethrella appendiculata TaxID=1370023 RepID=U5EFX9_9DIPT